MSNLDWREVQVTRQKQVKPWSPCALSLTLAARVEDRAPAMRARKENGRKGARLSREP